MSPLLGWLELATSQLAGMRCVGSSTNTGRSPPGVSASQTSQGVAQGRRSGRVAVVGDLLMSVGRPVPHDGSILADQNVARGSEPIACRRRLMVVFRAAPSGEEDERA